MLLCSQMWQFAPNSVHYLLSLWQRMVASVPYVKATEPHLLETYTPEVTNAYITSRLESVAVVVRATFYERNFCIGSRFTFVDSLRLSKLLECFCKLLCLCTIWLYQIRAGTPLMCVQAFGFLLTSFSSLCYLCMWYTLIK